MKFYATTVGDEITVSNELGDIIGSIHELTFASGNVYQFVPTNSRLSYLPYYRGKTIDEVLSHLCKAYEQAETALNTSKQQMKEFHLALAEVSHYPAVEKVLKEQLHGISQEVRVCTKRLYAFK